VSLPPSRSRRGRNLFERLRSQRDPISDLPDEDFARDGLPIVPPAEVEGLQTGSYDFLEAIASGPEDPSTVPSASNEDSTSTQALTAGEHPRRVAGVARSLGEPSVAVRPLAESGSVVSIVVAWELSWYRYEVDLGDEAAGAKVVAQGTELGELAREDLLVNVVADEHGTLGAVRV